MLEAATFYLDLRQGRFVDFDQYKSHVLSQKNIAEAEKAKCFWDWIAWFPPAVKAVLESESFARYLEWEQEWIGAQNEGYKTEMGEIWDALDFCGNRFQPPIQRVQIILSPIKCVYATDHHIKGDTLIYCSGALRKESLIHEFIHHVVHPAVEKRKADILTRSPIDPDVDASYYLDGGEAGRLNAFEEAMVRKLTDQIVRGDTPQDLDLFFEQELN